MLETLHAPDEVWLNDEIKHDLLDTYCLLKYYRDEVLAVNYRIEGEKLVLKTWYVMQTRTPGNRKVNLKKEIWDKRRRGLLIKSVGAHPRVRPNRKGGTMPSFLRPFGLDGRCCTPSWG